MLRENVRITACIPIISSEDNYIQPFISLLCQTLMPSEIMLIIKNDFQEIKNEILKVNQEITKKNNQVNSKSNQKFTLKTTPKLTFIKQEDNGIANARNIAIKKSKTRYLASLNTNSIASEDWLLNLYNCIKKQNLTTVGGFLYEVYHTKAPDLFRAIHLKQNWEKPLFLMNLYRYHKSDNNHNHSYDNSYNNYSDNSHHDFGNPPNNCLNNSLNNYPHNFDNNCSNTDFHDVLYEIMKNNHAITNPDFIFGNNMLIDLEKLRITPNFNNHLKPKSHLNRNLNSNLNSKKIKRSEIKKGNYSYLAFDNRYKTNYEDVDFSKRITLLGLKTAYCPVAIVYHCQHDTLLSVLNKSYNYSYFSYRTPDTFILLLFRILTETYKSIKYFFQDFFILNFKTLLIDIFIAPHHTYKLIKDYSKKFKNHSKNKLSKSD